ncbi:MAG: hypothetical protein IKS93_05780 [Methanobrevibacter sp.]|nr:hypothetical protein [Methanobrevibacter sp.]
MSKEHTPEEIKYRLTDLGVQIGNIAIEYIAELEKENELVKSLLYCTVKSCDNCGNCNCENFQRQRKSVPCELYVSYQDKIKWLEKQIEQEKNDYEMIDNCNRIHEKQLEQAKNILRELVDNQLMIRVHNPYADEKTNEMLEGALERWFKKAEQFLKETSRS